MTRQHIKATALTTLAVGLAAFAGSALAAAPADWSKVPGRTVTVFYPGVSPIEWINKGTEHSGARGPAPTVSAIAHRQVGDERRAEVDGEAGVGPLLEPRRHRGKQQHHAEELGPRELHPEVGGEAEVGERLRHLRQAQLRVGGEAYLQAEKRGDDPEADDDSF